MWTFGQAIVSAILAILGVLANTLRVFTRRYIGNRELGLESQIVISLLLIWNLAFLTLPLDLLKWWMPWLYMLRLPSFHSDGWLSAFGVLVLVMSVYRHWQVMRLLRSGRQWHTRSRGQSYFEFVSRHFRLVRLSQIYRFYEPAAWIGLGLCLGGALGYWIVFGACCLAVVERQRNMQELGPFMDDMDACIESKQRQLEIAHLQGELVVPGRLSIGESNGFSVGILTEITPPVRVIAASPDAFPPLSASLKTSPAS